MSQALATILPAPSPATLLPYTRRKACIGYVSQTEAVIALYEAACAPKLIAQRAGIPINSVHRAISDYRRATGRVVAPRMRNVQAPAYDHDQQHHPMWDMEEVRRRAAIIARAKAGARRTRLEAAGL